MKKIPSMMAALTLCISPAIFGPPSAFMITGAHTLSE